MKTVKTQFLCDMPDCGNYEWVDESKTTRELNADRKKRGWTKVSGKDYCPKCSDSGLIPIPVPAG